MVNRILAPLLLTAATAAWAGTPAPKAPPPRKPNACVATVERVQLPGGRYELVEALGAALAAAWGFPQCEGEAAEGGKMYDVDALGQRFELVVMGSANWRSTPAARPDGTPTLKLTGDYNFTLINAKTGSRDAAAQGALAAVEEPGGAAAAARASAKASALAVAKQFEAVLPLAPRKGK